MNANLDVHLTLSRLRALLTQAQHSEIMYILSSSNRRREFETLKEAVAVKAEGDDIYVSDAFGNCTTLSPDQMSNILKEEEKNAPLPEVEPVKAPQQEVKEAPQEPQQTAQLATEPKKQENTDKPAKWVVFVKYALYAGIAIVALYLLMTAALPALDGLLGVYNNVLG